MSRAKIFPQTFQTEYNNIFPMESHWYIVKTSWYIFVMGNDMLKQRYPLFSDENLFGK